MSDRVLVKVVIVDDVIQHTNADALELAIIGGWQCCVKKGEFKKGDVGVYFEIDSMLPLDTPEFAFLQGRNERTHEGKRYARIKTMKLRGELSQGLLLPLNFIDWTQLPETNGECLVEFIHNIKTYHFHDLPHVCEQVDKLPSILRVIKYEPAMPACLAGNAKGLFPSFLSKTDQERCQNLTRQIQDAQGEEFEVTYKLDGSSFTAFIYRDGGDEENVYTGVCSRNLELKVDETNEGNTFVETFKKYELDKKLREYNELTGRYIAIQGEMVGPGIQQNFEGLESIQLFIFSVFDITEQTYLLPDEAQEIVSQLGLNYVPVFKDSYVLDATVKELIEMADGESGLNGKFREGLVFKSKTRDFSFKSISNKYLMKTDN